MIDSVSDSAGASPDLKRARRHKVDITRIDRLPPHSHEAEQGVLGCCLLSPKDGIGRCIEKIKNSGVFYDLRHQMIYENLVAMFELNQGIDMITLQQWMKDAGELDQVGGIAYLNALQDSVPSAANLDFYLDILIDKNSIRKVIRTCTEVVGKAYDHQGEVDELLDDAERCILNLRNETDSAEIPTARTLVQKALGAIEKIHGRGGAISGMTTGFTDFDEMTDGLHGGEMIVIAARPSMGKAQPLSANILTPSGFTKMRNVKIGDSVIGSNGIPTKIIGVYPQGVLEVYKVEFSDGTSTTCCNDHLWFTQTRNERRLRCRGSVKRLDEVKRSISRIDSNSPNHAIPVVLPVQFSGCDQLPLHPWLVGALIGDGTLANGNILFSKPENDVQEKVRALIPAEDECVSGSSDGMTLRIKRKVSSHEKSETKIIINSLGLGVNSEQKFIPKEYLFASIPNRVQMLKGLIDTDGYVHDSGNSVEFSTSSKKLADDVAFLTRSLGGICSNANPRIPKYTHKGKKMDGHISYRMNIWFTDPNMVPCSSSKHIAKWKSSNARHVRKSITSVVKIGEEECQCIKIDSSDELYVTDDFILTHNTSICMNIAEHVALVRKEPVGVFSLEMTDEQLMTRLVCCNARVSMRHLKQGFLAESDFPKMTNSAGRLANAPLFIDDTSGLSILQLRARARRMWQMYGIKLLVIDYLQLLHSTSRKAQDNRNIEIADISGGIKGLAKDLGIPVLVASQLNRDMEKEKGRKPRLSDLRESGAIEQDADVVGLLYKPKVEDEEAEGCDGEAVNLLIAKQRNGPTGDVHLTFLKSFTRFESAAKVSDEDVPTDDNSSRTPHAD